jgi:hypothetical protein
MENQPVASKIDPFRVDCHQVVLEVFLNTNALWGKYGQKTKQTGQ